TEYEADRTFTVTEGDMSYFMTVSGTPPESRSEVEFVPAGESQKYVSDLYGKLSEQDGAPVFLALAGPSCTSSGFISDSVTHYHMNGSLWGSVLQQVIEDCFRQCKAFRIWWACDQPDDFAKVPSCNSLAEVMSNMAEQVRNGKSIAIRW